MFRHPTLDVAEQLLVFADRPMPIPFPLLLAGCAVLMALSTSTVSGQNGTHVAERPAVAAVARAGPIVIDGRPDEAAWSAAQPATDFRQEQPNEGEPAAQRTEVRFLFDESAIYVGARMFDELGAAGVRTRLGRRDTWTDSDHFEIMFDTFHDHLGRTHFAVNPSGVRTDGYGPGGSSLDSSWDPVWEVATHIDSLGWSAEMRIPLSQLRFPRDSVQTWGIQLWRFTQRLNEWSMFSFWTRQQVGGPAMFGHLNGLRFGNPPKSFEALPYVVARSAHVEPASAADPFNDGSVLDYRIGGDFKFLLNSSLTLSATLNPDFGQVEVDPAVVNLSAFETFFDERRPFFIEGAGMFGFGGLSCFFCSNVSSLNLFYSRRIGRSPQGFAHGDYVDMPENATILGAAKVTGRTAGGWTVGLLDAVTREESARVVDLEESGAHTLTRRPVEPQSNYFVGRIKRDLREGNLVVGGIATSVFRDLDDPALRALVSRRAETVGADMRLRWRDRRYSLWAYAAASNVAGHSDAMLRLQHSSARYFQRIDRDGGPRTDSSATSMQGAGGYARLAKDGGEWLWETSVDFRSPGFEVNDLAFLSRADYVWHNANLMKQWTLPGRWYRNASSTIGAQQRYNFDGDLTDRQLHYGLWAQLPNYWNVGGFVIRRLPVLDDRLTRGGPVVGRPGSTYWSSNVNTDSRKPLVVSVNPTYTASDDGARSWLMSTQLTVKPSPRIRLSIGPSLSRSESRQAFVASVAAPPGDTTAAAFGDRHYVFGDLVQRELSLPARLAVTFTPNLTLETYIQPLIASGSYSRFKEFAAPRSREMRVFGEDGGSTITPGGSDFEPTYAVDSDGDGTTDFSFAPRIPNSNFNISSLRGNAVLRWEYRPGSTLFFVWTQQRSAVAPFGDFDVSRDADLLLGSHPDNVFLVKVSYWIGR
jgi:hypothetical protein